jgi:hypothetical protein
LDYKYNDNCCIEVNEYCIKCERNIRSAVKYKAWCKNIVFPEIWSFMKNTSSTVVQAFSNIKDEILMSEKWV